MSSTSADAAMASPSPQDAVSPRDSLSMPPAPKRRAFSVSDRALYRGASSSALAARRVVSSAFTNVSRFVRSASTGEASAGVAATAVAPGARHEDGTLSLIDDPTKTLDERPVRGRAQSNPVAFDGSAITSATTSGSSYWKISSKLPQVPATFKALRRPRQLSLRRGSTSLVPWSEGHVQYVTSSYAHHGEDASAISSYYHIVADGISAPFAGQAPENVPEDRVSSAVIAQALVQAVEKALEDLTNRNKEPLDAAGFEQAVSDAIHATRVQCARHRESRIATTLCVVYFDRWSSKLLSFTLGDSKCIVLRRSEIVFESTCTVREFNVPCVVNLSHALEPNDFLVESFELAQGDVCLTFSDGLADNVYKDDILSAVETLENDTSTLQQICDSLVTQSAPEAAAPSPTPSPPTSASASASTDAPPRPSLEAAVDAVDPAGSPEETVTCATEALRERLHSASMDDANNTDTDAASPPQRPAVALSLPPPPPAETMASTEHTRPHKTPSKRFYPFATAAAYEYRRRVLRQKAVAPKELLADKNFQRHMRDSALLLDLHDGKSVLDRQVLVSKAHRRPHYSLVQLHRMAQIRAKKADDVTLLVTRFA